MSQTTNATAKSSRAEGITENGITARGNQTFEMSPLFCTSDPLARVTMPEKSPHAASETNVTTK
ncbi:hypothetical protein D3C83_90490 [compost metagenome]